MARYHITNAQETNGLSFAAATNAQARFQFHEWVCDRLEALHKQHAPKVVRSSVTVSNPNVAICWVDGVEIERWTLKQQTWWGDLWDTIRTKVQS